MINSRLVVLIWISDKFSDGYALQNIEDVLKLGIVGGRSFDC